jgi:thiol:disulfide interchange protein
MATVARVLALTGIPVVAFSSGAALVGGCSRASTTSEVEAVEQEEVGQVVEEGQEDGIAWVYDLDRGLEMAAEQGKPVMVDVYSDWCGWCKTLDEETYSDAQVQAKASRFVPVKVDAGRDETVYRKYGVEGLPTILFLNAKGEEIDRVLGFAPPEAFLEQMNRALSKAD